MVQTIKFSQFASGGDLAPGDITVGLLNGNAQFTNPAPLLATGDTATRPAITSAIYYRLRFNTDLAKFEYYSPVAVAWIQIEDSDDVFEITGTANQVLANGTSGVPQLGAVTLTTPQDIGLTSAVQFGSVRFNNNNAILDQNGAIMLAFSPQTAANNYMLFWNGEDAITYPAIQCAGASDDIRLYIVSKGQGLIDLSSASTTVPIRYRTGTTYQHVTQFAFFDTSDTRTVTYPDIDGTICLLDTVDNLPSSGFVPIGNGNNFTSAALTAGAGISIVNGVGSITISSSTSGMSWSTTTVSVNPTVIDSGYVANSAGVLTFTLPASAAVGDVIAVEGLGAGGWIVTANTGQTINLGSQTTSTAGSLASTNAGDNVYVICIVANTTWRVRTTNSAGLTIS